MDRMYRYGSQQVLLCRSCDGLIRMFPCEEIIESGRCSADCCGIVPINRMVFKLNKRHYQVKIKDLIKTSRIEVYPITEDGRCIFLNRSTKRCSIYFQRPLICRNYGRIDGLPCPFIAQSGKKRTPKESKIVQEAIDHKIDMDMELLRKRYAD